MAPPTPIDERSSPAALVARIREGEPAAGEELVERYSRGVSMLLRRTAGLPHVADDLYQDVFLLAVEKIRRGELRDPERLSGFICALARNLAIGHFRRNPPAESIDAGAALSVPEPAPGPLERVLRVEDARMVRQVLAELPTERDRQVLYRFYIAEEDKETICAGLGLSTLQFNRVLHRARERFRELYSRPVEQSGRPTHFLEGR